MILPTVPPEYTGKARQFIMKTERAFLTAHAFRRGLLDQLSTRLDNRQPLRRDALQAVADAFARRADPFRMSQSIVWNRQHSRVTVSEVRLVTTRCASTSWKTVDEEFTAANSEHTVSVCRETTHVGLREWQIDFRLEASLGLHALARWYQRSFRDAEADLWPDLQSVGNAGAAVVQNTWPQTQQVRVDSAASGGCWLGGIPCSMSERLSARRMGAPGGCREPSPNC